MEAPDSAGGRLDAEAPRAALQLAQRIVSCSVRAFFLCHGIRSSFRHVLRTLHVIK